MIDEIWVSRYLLGLRSLFKLVCLSVQTDTKQKPINYSSVNEFLSNVRNCGGWISDARSRFFACCGDAVSQSQPCEGIHASLSLHCLCCVAALDLCLSSAVPIQCDPSAIVASLPEDLAGGLEHSLSNPLRETSAQSQDLRCSVGGQRKITLNSISQNFALHCWRTRWV